MSNLSLLGSGLAGGSLWYLRDTPFANSIVAYHKLNEISGNRLDSIGSSTLTAVNTPGSAAGITHTLAAQLAIASSQFMFAADSAVLSGGNIDMWGAIRIVPAAVNVTSCIYGKWTTTNNNREWQLLQISDGITLQVSPDGTGTANGVVSAGGVLRAGEPTTIMWYHDSVNDLLGLSINGAGFITAAYSGGIFDSASAYTIGRQGQAGATYYGGLVQDALLGKGYIPTIPDSDYFYNVDVPYGVVSVQFLAYGGEPDWSVDGTKIVFDRRISEGGKYQIYMINPDGTDEVCLTDPPGINAPAVTLNKGWPSFHPSGDYLLCQAEMPDHGYVPGVGEDDLTEPGRGLFNDAYAYVFATNTWYQLTFHNPAAGEGMLNPRFNNEGDKILWANRTGAGGGQYGQWQLSIADFSTPGGVPTISNISSFVPGDKFWFESHGFSRDDSRIVYTSDPDDGNEYAFDIFTADLDGSNVVNITATDAAWEEHAHYAKHGDYIAFMSSVLYPAYTAEVVAGLRSELMVTRSDGTHQRRVTRFNLPGFSEYNSEINVATACAWNPPGSKLVVAQLLLGASYDTVAGRMLWTINFRNVYSE